MIGDFIERVLVASFEDSGAPPRAPGRFGNSRFGENNSRFDENYSRLGRQRELPRNPLFPIRLF
jgi:hypothetical protein